MRISAALLLIASMSGPALAQVSATPLDAPARFWVFFRDKGLAGPALDAALASLPDAADPRTLRRRQLRRTAPGLFDARDLPVNAAYADAVAASGARPRHASRWLNAVSVAATPAQLGALASLPFVDRVEPVRAGSAQLPRDVRPITRSPYAGRDFYGESSAQLHQIGVAQLHAAGFTAQGVVIGILDTGFRTDHDAFTNPAHPLNIIAEHDFIFDDAEAANEPADDPGQHNHGTLILGCIAAYLPNQLVGGAFDASVILCKTEDIRSETPVEEDNYVAGLEFIELHGGDMATSSLGYIDWYAQSQLDGLTAVTTIAINVATENGVHCCTAAGNGGHDNDPATSRLLAPSDALRVIACGAARSNGETSDFSSDGPSADGRVKPELLARGSGTRTVHYDNTTDLAGASGTSLSTPLVAAAVACLIQAHPDWTTDQMRAALFATASEMVANAQPDPLFVRGFGILDAHAASLVTFCQPDFDQNGVADQDDVAYLVNVVAGGDNPLNADPDFDRNGIADQDDLAALINVIAGGVCP